MIQFKCRSVSAVEVYRAVKASGQFKGGVLIDLGIAFAGNIPRHNKRAVLRREAGAAPAIVNDAAESAAAAVGHDQTMPGYKTAGVDLHDVAGGCS